MRERQRIRIFSTIGDVGTLLMSLIYIAYITMLLVMSIGVFWLNIAILVLTGLYFIFFVLKVLYLNSRLGKIGRPVKLVMRYSKYFVRLINATIVIISLVNLSANDGSDLIKIVSIVILLVMLAISITIDVSMIFVRRKFREIKAEWENLPAEEKHNKIEYLTRRVLTSIDSSGELEKFLLTHKDREEDVRLETRAD
ncbi:MAG: hypothetical protein FWE31_04865 [Firmicutes bacterium]|nr:hypothetical protein [Bacillota bacterium]